MPLISNCHIRIFYWLCVLKLVSCLLFKYDVEVLSDTIITPCEEYPDNSYVKFFDPSELSVTRNDDGSTTMEGIIKVIYQLQKAQHKLRVEFFKRERGAWQKTIYSLTRPDFCKAMFSENEYWSHYFSNLTKAEKTCPISIGRTFTVFATSKDPVEFPDRTMAGEYNGRIEIGNPGEEEFFCADLFVNLYRR